MIIQTKFDVNNIVKHKFQSPLKYNGNNVVLEVMQIRTDTVLAGSESFYLCRSIFIEKKFENKFKQEGEFTWSVAHGIKKDVPLGVPSWEMYREDELVAATQEEIDIVLGSWKPNNE